MQHRFGRFVQGLFALGAAIAHALPAQAQAGPSPRFPANGAADVVLNPELRVEFPGVAGALEGPFDDAFRVRGGGIVLAAREVELLLRSDGVEFDSAAVSLAANTAYTIETRINACAEGAPRLCWDDEWRPIGEFTTGSERDLEGPTASLVAEPELVPASADGCDWRVRLSAADDHSPSEELRYVSAPAPDGTAPRSSSELELRAPASPAGAETVIVQVSALDASGNAGPPVDVTLPACFAFDLALLGCDTGPPECETDDSGCALAPGGPVATGGVRVALASLVSLLVVALARARRRAA